MSLRLLLDGRHALASVGASKGERGVPPAVLYDMSTEATAGLGEWIPGTLSTPMSPSDLSLVPSTMLFWEQDAQPRRTVVNLLTVTQ
ncbi:hypothetical protein [Nonomuraea sp. NPDC049400]|uniref:hypothetical protein n=1 Tax=Nonomuraea sp. NPDC049400 TaxID=3364352 RepID=UPI0037B17987